MRMKNKKWSRPFLATHDDVVIEDFDNENLIQFLQNAPIYLEIGTGKGGFIVDMAKNNPNISFLGVEKSITCLAITAKKVVESNLTNVRLMAIDVGQVLEKIAAKTFDGIFLNFSDPWHKARHAKRRLTAPLFLKSYERILKNNGQLVMKTDNLNLFNYSLETINESNLKMIEHEFDYTVRAEFDVETEYEAFFRKQGTTIKRLIARKED